MAKLPGAKQDPSNACLAEDNSPNWANAWARSALSSRICSCLADASTASALTCLLAQTQQVQPMTLGKESESLLELLLGILPPRAPRYNNNRGIKRNNFQPLTLRTSLDSGRPRSTSSRANRKQERNAPFKKAGGLLNTRARFANASAKSTPSRVLNATRVTTDAKTSSKPLTSPKMGCSKSPTSEWPSTSAPSR